MPLSTFCFTPLRLEITMNTLEAKLNSIPEDALAPASSSSYTPTTTGSTSYGVLASRRGESRETGDRRKRERREQWEGEQGETPQRAERAEGECACNQHRVIPWFVWSTLALAGGENGDAADMPPPPPPRDEPEYEYEQPQQYGVGAGENSSQAEGRTRPAPFSQERAERR